MLCLGTVVLTALEVADRSGSSGKEVLRFDVDLGPGPGAIQWFSLPENVFPDPNSTLLIASLLSESSVASSSTSFSSSPSSPSSSAERLLPVASRTGQNVLSQHIVALGYPHQLRTNLALDVNVTAAIATSPNVDGSVNVTVAADAVALWVTLTSLAQGRFSDNAFLLLPGDANKRTVQFVPFRSGTGTEDLETLHSSLRVEHYAMYA